MKTLLLAGLAGVTSMLPAAALANDSAPGVFAPADASTNVQNPAQHRVNYDNNILMNDDRVTAYRPGIRSGSSTYQGDWKGAYRQDGTYQGEWQGTYRGADGKVYDGQYAGTFIGEGTPSQVGASYVDEAPMRTEITPERAGTDYEAPRYEDRQDDWRPRYAQAPVAEYRAPAAHSQRRAQYSAQQQPPYQTQYHYPSGWNGNYYPAYSYPGGTTIVIQSAPGTTTTTYYED